MSRINETKQMVWHKTCKCVCKLTSAICNSRQPWNKDKCQCECKEDLINKLTCDKGYIWNPSTCTCECDKQCDAGQYLDHKNWVCRKSLIDKMFEQCISVVDEDIMRNKTLDIKSSDYNSNTTYIVLFLVFLSISVIIGGTFFYWYKYKRVNIRNNYIDVSYSMAGKINY